MLLAKLIMIYYYNWCAVFINIRLIVLWTQGERRRQVLTGHDEYVQVIHVH